MTLIVEDGTGRADAQAYCSVAFSDAYHVSRGLTVWMSMLTEEKEAALVRATQFITQEYRRRWAGWRTSQTQALDWPRVGVPVIDGPIEGGLVASNIVPIEVQQATAELALKAAAVDLSPDIDRSSAVKREKLDVLEVEYRDNAPMRTRYQSTENLLAPLLLSVNGASGGGSMTVVRS